MNASNEPFESAFKVAPQLVIDALKLSPANPGFLDMRDAVFSTLDDHMTAAGHSDSQRQDLEHKLWTVFARFGMGPDATSFGASLSGISPDFSVPAIIAPPVFAEAEPNLDIPDNNPAGVSSALTLEAGNTTIGKITVNVDIRHTFIGDLVVELEGPTGTQATLHNRSGGRADNVIAEYRSDNTSSLAPLVGTEADGTWTIRIRDLAGIDTGQLKFWRISVEPISDT